MRAVDPDSFLVELDERAPAPMVASLAAARANLRRSGVSPSAFLAILGRQRLVRLAARLAARSDDL